MACRISELVIDCRDPERLAAFWCDVLGYVVLDQVEGSVEIGPSCRAGQRAASWLSQVSVAAGSWSNMARRA
jgi:hypothetical protein